jgi:hypothetical protein
VGSGNCGSRHVEIADFLDAGGSACVGDVLDFICDAESERR